MAKLLNYSDVKAQSEQVFGQFGEKVWLPNAKINMALPRRPTEELKFSGLGKTLVLAVMGESTEEHIEEIKKHRDEFDLAVCDKLFGYMVERGITPDYVMISDANIPFRWLEKHVAATKGVKLIATPYANPEWTKVWQGPRYFYVNMDAIQTEKHFTPMFPDSRVIPAASNVSNAMVVFFTGADNKGAANWAGYERYILMGYDYSWRPHESLKALNPGLKTGKYYAFEDPTPKRFYMNHRTIRDFKNDWVHTSENLYFSAKWLFSYVTSFNLPVINCSGRGIMGIPAMGKFSEEIVRMKKDPAKIGIVREMFNALKKATQLAAAAREQFERSREALYGRG